MDISWPRPGASTTSPERGDVKLRDVDILVLTTADRILDMGFWP